jgi:hypothetical protein
VHGKDFRFYKQHAVGHVVEDIEQKGTMNNYNMRPDEGFFQEVEEAYSQTNMKNEDLQVKKAICCHLFMLILTTSFILRWRKLMRTKR